MYWLCIMYGLMARDAASRPILAFGNAFSEVAELKELLANAEVLIVDG